MFICECSMYMLGGKLEGGTPPENKWNGFGGFLVCFFCLFVFSLFGGLDHL